MIRPTKKLARNSYKSRLVNFCFEFRILFAI